ncbi:hypothetical protein OG874_39725 [Nocardia sp. NBC_00565]|uniref:hypothetical protein n=1 Tax=Nocardia sp. NBC_00565 TaxID=2975993 RepID=UPI002E810624|nr:hypothetical protein [Nocardia sp. NBC_00565]WUC02764.1 hypothetical protein OG874_39725 [Nocardia sp. NBC_00565]
MPPQRRKGSIGKGAIGGANPLADSAEHTPPVSPLRDAEWRTGTLNAASVDVIAPLADAAAPVVNTAAPVVNSADGADVLMMPLPAPGEAALAGPLDDREQAQLTACESSIDGLRVAFWAAGRALQIVRDGRLYRDRHATFDEYVEQRWDMQRSYAHKLIRAWPLAAKLHPVAPAINEGQVRELLPVAVQHGEDAAVTVYTTIAGTDDVKVTAGMLREAVALLPERFDKAEVVALLQAWLRGELRDESNARAVDLFAAVESRFAALTRRVVKGSNNDPAAAREFAAKLRTLAEQIEEQITA